AVRRRVQPVFPHRGSTREVRLAVDDRQTGPGVRDDDRLESFTSLMRDFLEPVDYDCHASPSNDAWLDLLPKRGRVGGEISDDHGDQRAHVYPERILALEVQIAELLRRGLVQGDDPPGVVAHRRAGGARRGI